MDRIILTDNEFTYNLCTLEIRYTKGIHTLKELKDQILEYQTVCEVIDLHSVKELNEIKEKAKKWDNAWKATCIDNPVLRTKIYEVEQELCKTQILYNLLKEEFEDLAKEDCLIRQQAIKDIGNLRKNLAGEKLLSEKRRTDGIEMLLVIKVFKEELETMTNVSSFYLKKATALREALKIMGDHSSANTKLLVDNHRLEKKLEKLKELIEEKEGWLRVNTYRISKHQHDIVENEINELKEILGNK